MKEYVPEPAPLPDPVEEVFGSTEPKIIGKRQVRDIRKRCFLTSGGGSLSVYDTNDVGMKATAGKITITRAGYYDVRFSSDVSPVWTTAQTDLYVNATPVDSTLYQNYYTSAARIILNGSKILKLKNGDVVSIVPSGGSVNQSVWYWLQVWEL